MTARAPQAAAAAPAETAGQIRFARTVHVGFLLLLAVGALRYVIWRDDLPRALPALAAAAALAAVYLTGVVGDTWRGHRQLWLLAVVAGWTGLTLWISPFSWCAVPLFFVVLRALKTRAAIPVVLWLAVVAGVVQDIHARQNWDPSPLISPIIIALLVTVLFHQMHTESRRREALIADLVRTRDALGRSERAAGVLQERVRLSREIHDTVTQGLSSMHLLLNAADQQWTSAPAQARGHVRQAADEARANLAEARRLVQGLAPPALDGGSLGDALRRLCDTTATGIGLAVSFVLEGQPYHLDVATDAALLRVAQGALANVVQHAGARTAVVTLTYLPDSVTLDVCDDGAGFDAATPPAAPERGYGLRAIRDRITALGGTATVESRPGDGTVVAVTLPGRVGAPSAPRTATPVGGGS
jgi:signal transduction histidine kinase